MINAPSSFRILIGRGMCPLSKHNRRDDGYWKYYRQAHTLEKDVIVRNIVSLVKENPAPYQKKSNRGRKPIHSFIHSFMGEDGLHMRTDGNIQSYIQEDAE